MQPTSAAGNRAIPARGFTLLELLIVLGLAALVLAVALPNLRSSPATELRSGAQTVAAALRQTRIDAMSRGRPQALLVDTRKHSLSPEQGQASRRLPDGIAIKLSTAEQEMLDDGRGGIRFWPDGSATGGRVTLAKDGLRIRVDVEWLTGRVRISELEGG